MKLFAIVFVFAIHVIAFSQSSKKVIPDSTLWIANKYDTLIFDSLLLDAKDNGNGKPLLLYFYGSSNVNSWKFNTNVLSDTTVRSVIQSKFYPVLLDVESRMPTLRMGKKNFEFQQKMFSYATQPFFVIIDLNGNVISKKGYLGNEYRLTEEFIIFLAEGFEACEN